ncbi:hypothetical protein PsorP6_007672 [Peronosclerospora sorghi]|uniref:Uncharacterized protein n=1 Tax=Peronosclerospora sorghi TaxID=230839 RepID=A0ACC0WBZ0_9STRA|nr:hypothetical protein PsorP6_007672 [Peronosclerospora sorghi]
MLENVWIDANNEPDYFNSSKTENGRVSYTIYHLPRHEPNSRGNHPNAFIFLTCDAYGVLPPLSKLSTGQAQYHFLSGIFDAASNKYASILKKKLQEKKTPVYLINTGWTAGVYGVGKRMKLPFTRMFVGAVLDGSITEASFVKDPLFGFEIPTKVNGVPSEILNPSDAWSDKAAFDQTALKLAKSFKENFKQFILPENDLSIFGPTV